MVLTSSRMAQPLCDCRVAGLPSVDLRFAVAAAPGDFARSFAGVRGIEPPAAAFGEVRLGHWFSYGDAEKFERMAWVERSAVSPSFGQRGLSSFRCGELIRCTARRWMPGRCRRSRVRGVGDAIGADSFAEEVLRTFGLDFFEHLGECGLLRFRDSGRLCQRTFVQMGDIGDGGAEGAEDRA